MGFDVIYTWPRVNVYSPLETPLQGIAAGWVGYPRAYKINFATSVLTEYIYSCTEIDYRKARERELATLD